LTVEFRRDLVSEPAQVCHHGLAQSTGSEMIFDHLSFLPGQQAINISGALLKCQMLPEGGFRRQFGVESHRIVIQHRFDRPATLPAFGQMIIHAEQFCAREILPAIVIYLCR
jgi:hypothetical protein